MLKRIKRHIYQSAIYSATAICMGVVAVSCSDDAIGNTDNKGSGNEVASYHMAIKLIDAADGIAIDTEPSFDSNFPDFEDGDVYNKGLYAEKAIYDNYKDGMPNFIMLFDEDGKKIGDLTHIKPFLPEETEDPETGNEDHSSYSLFVATFDEDKVLRSADKILVVLNASPNIRQKLNSKQKYKDIIEIEMSDGNATNPDFLYLNADGTKYFTMSSSMVVKTTKAEDGAESKEVTAATNGALTEHLYTTKAEALANPFAMYVERTQSKYTVLFEKKTNATKQYYFDNTSGNTSANATSVTSLVYEYDQKDASKQDFKPNDETGLKYVASYTRSDAIDNRGEVIVQTATSWKVNIAGWGVNGLEKNEYLFKYIQSDADYFNGWKSSKYDYRNFWAEDINYKKGTYPDQYRVVLWLNENNQLVKDGQVNTVEGTSSSTILNYFKFSDLNQKAPHQYSPENTFGESVFGTTDKELKEAFESKAFLRAGTHIIVTAQLLLEGLDTEAYAAETFDGKGFVSGVADKLYMNNIYWSETAYKNYVAEYLAYWMLTEENQEKEKFGPNDGNFYVQDENDDTSYRLATGDDFKLEPANIKGGDGWVYLSPKDNVILYTKTTDKEGNGKYKEINADKYEVLAYEHQDLMAGHFSEGRMYYAVPVQHNLNTSSKNTIATGDYGAVRNHWYSFTVNNIFSVGTPVDNPEEPIIPNVEPKNPGLGVEISILNWHQVSTDVDISNQRPNNNKSYSN